MLLPNTINDGFYTNEPKLKPRGEHLVPKEHSLTNEYTFIYIVIDRFMKEDVYCHANRICIYTAIIGSETGCLWVPY